ncbi:hypothetical protein BJY00DRAFT_317525 [Aspergillus carlsbadensis]|nr:hypothetical protein BJY00DRAFT_317525 [Aspergillus carlsbadensis]
MAHHVMVLCEPSLITSVESEIETTTCSTTTTVAITRCSATDSVTTITSTATPTETACAKESCGSASCPVGDGGWVTINPIDCAKVSTLTIGSLPSTTCRPDHTIPPKVIRRVYVKHGDEDSVNPLPSLPALRSELTGYLNNLGGRLTAEGKWLGHKNGDTTGKWYIFANEKTAAGVTGVFGCTSIVIVSKHGVYLSHIYEDPVFVQKTKLGFLRPTTDKVFQEASFDTLVNGDPESGELEPLSILIGTTENPGPLHYTLQPKIFAITPFKHGGIGPLMYAKRIEWLSNQLHNYLYPAGSEQHDQKPELIPYKIAPQYLAENPESLSGKIIVEATQLDHYEQSGDQLSAIGRCRLWVNGKEGVTWEFLSQGSVNAVGYGLNVLRARDDHYAGICPVSTLPSIQTSTTFITTTTPISSLTSTPPATTSAATSTSAAPLPSDPSLIGKPQCYEHSDSSPTTIDSCTVESNSDKCFGGTTIPAEKFSLGGPGGPSSISWTVDNYFTEIKFDPRCEGPAQNPLYPMVGLDCQSIIKENFGLKSCVTKNGIGGSIRVG